MKQHFMWHKGCVHYGEVNDVTEDKSDSLKVSVWCNQIKKLFVLFFKNGYDRKHCFLLCPCRNNFPVT
jgi:hypothetical protein